MSEASKKLKSSGIEVCDEAVDWIEERPGLSLQELWDTCDRPDWMICLLWVLDVAAPYRDMAYEFAVHSVSLIDHAGTRDQCCDSLDALSKYIDTGEESHIHAAIEAAFEAAWDAVLDVALDDPREAAREAAWDSSREFARAAGWAASRDGATVEDWDAARAASRARAWLAQADIIRYFVPDAPTIPESLWSLGEDNES